MFPGTPELLIIAAIVILLFGARSLPKLAKGIKQAVTEFRTEAKSPSDEDVHRQSTDV